MARGIGTVTWGSTSTCPVSALPTTQCLTFTVDGIPNVTGDLAYQNNVAALGGRAKVSRPASPIGTVVLAAGGGGGGFYEQALANCLANVCTPLYNAGFIVVQVAWNDPPIGNTADVFSGSQGALALMARTATIFRAIYDNGVAGLYVPGTPFIICGQSGGSSQVGYTIANYIDYTKPSSIVTGDYIDMAIMTSGPPHARLDLGCMGALNPAWLAASPTYKTVGGGLIGFVQNSSALFSDWSNGADFADAGYSAYNVKSAMGGAENRPYRDSVANGAAVTTYPKTDIRALYGDADSSEACPLGRLFTKSSGYIGGPPLAGKTYSESITTGGIDHVNVPGSTSGSAYIVASILAATFNH